MKNYQALEMTVIVLENADIVTTSGGGHETFGLDD